MHKKNLSIADDLWHFYAKNTGISPSSAQDITRKGATRQEEWREDERKGK